MEDDDDECRLFKLNCQLVELETRFMRQLVGGSPLPLPMALSLWSSRAASLFNLMLRSNWAWQFSGEISVGKSRISGDSNSMLELDIQVQTKTKTKTQTQIRNQIKSNQLISGQSSEVLTIFCASLEKRPNVGTLFMVPIKAAIVFTSLKLGHWISSWNVSSSLAANQFWGAARWMLVSYN